ncbi:MAG: glycosyltransferase [Longispora sp.]|nr:glycosyltransferase [Longispora sp. (in: high G+C Gram-positive bacteria)]
MTGTDILMVTYERAEYVRLSLPRLLETCGPEDTVWLWHNGQDPETLAAVKEYAEHPKIARFHHSPDNVGIRMPTNWLWAESDGPFLSKVDDDCLVSPGWLETLRTAHEDVPEFGVLGSWRYPDEDYRPDVAIRKIGVFGEHKLLRNHWVQGSGYMVKREVLDGIGPLTDDHSFTSWCLEAARAGWVNGWYFPFVREEHMDDPRSPHTMYRTDADLIDRMPLSAKTTGVRTIEAWTAQMRRSAEVAQTASLDLKEYFGWRRTKHSFARKVRRAITGQAPW